MEHLKNWLLGVGEVLTAFGTAPEYQYPKAGEMTEDKKKLRQDLVVVGEGMSVAVIKTAREANVQINHRPSKRKGSASDNVSARDRFSNPANRAA
jgi:hypothetical protein